MRRLVEASFISWSQQARPKPLILRGARQVGKSYLANKILSKFVNSFTINFERKEHSIYRDLFKSKSVKDIIEFINIQNNLNLSCHDSILFIDEIQECPEAIQALRFFYEDMPGLRIVAAGSLLDFALNNDSLSVPVGRIDYLYIHPLSFIEFLYAIDKSKLVDYIFELNLSTAPKFDFHDELLELVKIYMLTGGMPAVLQKYLDNHNMQDIYIEQNSILETFRDDFCKYGSKAEQKYLKMVFDSIPLQLGNKFVFSRVDSEQKSKDLKNALNLLVDANIAKTIYRSSPAINPLGAGIEHKFFKVNFLDIGLANRIFNLAITEINELDFFGNHAGKITEQFVAQELIAYSDANLKSEIYYWAREDKSNAAEIDYLINIDGQNIPIEVKAAHGNRLKSLKQAMELGSGLIGVKISKSRLSREGGILSLPLYAVAGLRNMIN